MKGMKHTDMVDLLADRSGVERRLVSAVLEELADLAAEEIGRNGRFRIRSVGELRVKHINIRANFLPGDAPVTKVPVIRFKPAEHLKDGLRGYSAP